MVDSSAPNSLIELGRKHRNPEAKRVLAPVVGFLIAETSILVGQITFGLLVHASMLLMLFWMIATSSESNRVFEAFVFIPLLRLLNLGTGVISFDPILWLVGVYGLLLASLVLVMRGHEVGLADLGLERYGTRRQWLIGGLGVVLGIGFGIVQWTFQLEELPIEPTLANAVVMALVLGLLVGFVEDLLFRGLLQRWLEEVLPATSAVLVASLLFGFMHSIWLNPADVVFTFAVRCSSAGCTSAPGTSGRSGRFTP